MLLDHTDGDGGRLGKHPVGRLQDLPPLAVPGESARPDAGRGGRRADGIRQRSAAAPRAAGSRHPARTIPHAASASPPSGRVGPPGRDLPPGATPRRRAWLWAAGVCALLVVALAAGLLVRQLAAPPPAPTALGTAHLTGPRTPEPVAIIIVLDNSGSFARYTHVRDQVLDSISGWAPDNLRGDDQLAVISFASDAAVQLPATQVADLASGAARLTAVTPTGGGTNILPALDLARGQRYTPGAKTSLVVVTDSVITDLDARRVAAALTGLDVSSMSVITPRGVTLTRDWRAAFAGAHQFTADPASEHEVSVALGEAFAVATGQRLTFGP